MKLPSRSTAIALVALIFAVSGPAVAATKQLITSAQIKNGIVTGADLKNGTVQNGDIKAGTITQARLSTGV